MFSTNIMLLKLKVCTKRLDNMKLLLLLLLIGKITGISDTCQTLYVTCRHTCQNLYVTCRHTYSAPLRYIAIKTNSTQNRTFKRSFIAQI